MCGVAWAVVAVYPSRCRSRRERRNPNGPRMGVSYLNRTCYLSSAGTHS